MSGSQIGSVVGAAIGVILAPATGGASLIWAANGMAIGGAIGGLLMPDEVGLQDQHGPRLTDLKITSTTYGAVINRVYGSYRVGGNMIYASDIKETKHVREEEVGKGGSETYEVITYTYAVDMAIAFCEGEVDDVIRIWADSVLIYDINQGGYTAAFKESEEKSGKIQLYKGSSTQSIDWFLQSQDSDSPAYRNVCYIRFKDFQLEMFGNRIPNITAEIVNESGRAISSMPTIYSIQQETQGEYFTCMLSATRERIRYVSANYDNAYRDIHWTVYDIFPSGATKIINVIWRDYFDKDDLLMCTYGTDYLYLGRDFRTDSDNFMLGKIHQNLAIVNAKTSICPGVSVTMPNILGKVISSTNTSSTYITKNDMYMALGYNTSSESTSPYTLVKFSLGGIATDTVPFEPEFIDKDLMFVVVRPYNGYVYLIGIHKLTDIVTVATYTEELNFVSKFTTTETLPEQGGNTSTTIDIENDEIIFVTNLNYQNINLKTQKVSARYVTPIYVNPINSLTNDGIIFSFVTYTSDNSKSPDYNTLKFDRAYVNGVSDSGESLSGIVAKLLESSGVYDYDVSDGDSISVTGLLVNQVSSARSVISILQSAYSFDLIEEGFVIVLRTRKSDIEYNLSFDDLLKGYDMMNSLETDLPNSITFKYANKSLEYLSSSQSSMRIDSISDNEIGLSLPLVLTDTEAKRLTEINLFRAWRGKTKIKFTTTFHDINVSDLINVEIEDIVHTIRLTSVLITTTYALECVGLTESIGINDSDSIGADTSEGFYESEIKSAAPSDLLLFNAPTLDNSILNDNGVYYASKGLGVGWSGATLFKSKDSGQTYENVGSILNPGCFGETRYALQDGPTTLLDANSSIQVYSSSNEFLNITYEELLNGKNYIKIGNEILQYMEYTDDGDGLYTLSVLLRGRRGTEWAVGDHQSLESFVLLDFRDVQFSFSTISTERLYKAVTFGTYLEDSYEEKITYDGTNLKPFSPTMVYYSRNSNDDIYVKWSRRDRYITGHLRALPLSETVESYNIDVYYYGVFKESITISDATSFTYSESDQIAQGITVGDTINFHISQISQVYGNGEAYYLNAYTNSILYTNLILYFKLDESTQYDDQQISEFINGGALDGTFYTNSSSSSSPAGLTTLGGYSKSFNHNSTSYIECQASDKNSIETTGELGISLYFQSAVRWRNQPIITVESEWKVVFYHSQINRLSVVLYRNNGSPIKEIRLKRGFSDSTTYHLAVNFQGNFPSDNISVYIDGISEEYDIVQQNDDSLGSVYKENPLMIGADKHQPATGTTYSGVIDDVRIFDKLLTSEQITEFTNLKL